MRRSSPRVSREASAARQARISGSQTDEQSGAKSAEIDRSELRHQNICALRCEQHIARSASGERSCSSGRAGMPATRRNDGGINPAQIAAIQARMASMGMSGMMGNMGMGMGGFALNYPPEQMPHVFLKVATNKASRKSRHPWRRSGRSNTKAAWGRAAWRCAALTTEGLSFAAMGAGPAGMMAMSAFSMAPDLCPACVPARRKSLTSGGFLAASPRASLTIESDVRTDLRRHSRRRSRCLRTDAC